MVYGLCCNLHVYWLLALGREFRQNSTVAFDFDYVDTYQILMAPELSCHGTLQKKKKKQNKTNKSKQNKTNKQTKEQNAMSLLSIIL